MNSIKGVVISLTDVCNITCSYCFEDKKPGSIKAIPNYEHLIDDLKKVISESTYKTISISFYGGEPLLQLSTIKNIVDCLDTDTEKEIQWGIATNGALINQEILNYLKAHKFDVQISLDGNKYVHNLNRKEFDGGGSYEGMNFILSKIRELYKVTARVTVTPNNAKHFDKSIHHLIDIGFDSNRRKIKYDFDFSACWDDIFISELADAFERLEPILEEHYKAGGRCFIEPLNKAILDKKLLGNYCGAGKSTIHINPSGKVYPCNRLTTSHAKDNDNLLVSDGSIKLANVDNVIGNIFPEIQRKPDCDTCKARNYCELICPARLKSGSGSFDRISNIQCATTRLTSKAAMNLKKNLRPSEKVSLVETYNLESIFL